NPKCGLQRAASIARKVLELDRKFTPSVELRNSQNENKKKTNKKNARPQSGVAGPGWVVLFFCGLWILLGLSGLWVCLGLCN
ncbi:hypothetical protein, partial [Neisseria sp. P0006.S009]|uniref:hypothetical protein n=1 Tax=Neisseria sp. P0006.S009 TaxID=3436692 RepID=UPI003F806BA9